MFKSLLIFISLVLWSILADSASCVVFAFYVVAITTLLTIALSEMKIVNKYVIAQTIFHSETSLFHIIKSVWFTLFLSLIVAFVLSVILLVQSIYFSPFIFMILGLDVVLIWMLNKRLKSKLSLTIKSPFLDILARRWSSWINTIFLLLVFVIYQFYATPTNEVQIIECQILDFLSSTLRYKELIEWKLVSFSMNSFDSNDALYAWMFYLLISQGIFAWAYSKLLLSVDIPKAIIKTDKSLQVRNYFILGFVGAILLLLISTLTINHLYEKNHMKKVQKLVQKAYVDIDNTLNKQLKLSEQKILDEVDKIIDKEIDTVFEPVYGAIGNLSDYYYSVKGEYTRIILKGHDLYCGYKNNTLVPYYNQYLPNGYKLKKCNEKMLDDEIQARVNKYLFTDNNFEMNMGEASQNINNSILNNINNLRDELKNSISSMQKSENVTNNELIESRLQNINSGFEDILEASSRDMAKKSLSGTGAVLLTSSISKTIMSKMLLKLGAKSAAKGASFVAGSATGLTVCAPTGPWALLCGVVTGTASWIGVDAAMTEIDQAFNEDDFQLSVKKMLDSEKQTLKTLMKDSYHKWILEIFKELEDSSKSSKSPHEQLQKE